MSAKRYQPSISGSGVNLRTIPKAASTAMTENTLGTIDANGRLTPATATSTALLGLIVRRVASTDTDYADTSTVMCDEARDGDTFEMDIDSSTGVDKGDQKTLISASQVKGAAPAVGERTLVNIVEVLSATKVVVTLKTFTQIGVVQS